MSEGTSRSRTNTILGGITDDQLEHFIEQAASLSETNCWFFEYALKDTLLEFAYIERRERQRRKEAIPVAK